MIGVKNIKSGKIYRVFIMYLFFILFSLLVILGYSKVYGQTSLQGFKPAQVWPDNNNIHINAHGGGIIESNGRYYWFGEHKIKGRRGNSAQVGVHCYSSSDLVNWVDEGIALKVVENDTTHPITKGSVIERPKVVYNSKNSNYVMWFHLEEFKKGYSSAMSGVATSMNITGPYKLLKASRPDVGRWPVNYPDSLKNKNYHIENLKDWSDEWKQAVKEGMFLQRDIDKGQMSRDMTIFIDDDLKAYHIHASEENLTLHISELNDDYTGFTGTYYRVSPGGHNEAPAVFKKDGKYFMFTSGCTGWDPNAARLLTTRSISGEWEYKGNPCRGKDANLTFFSQSTYVIPYKKDKFIFMADRWKPENPIDGTYVWLPVQFDKDGLPFLEWYDEWNLNDL